MSHSEFSNTTILVVDDDTVTRLMLKKVLARLGFNIIESVDGQQGFSAFLALRPDLILMDVMMPNMNGYDTTQAIRNYEKSSQSTPILMLTSLDDVDSVDEAFDAGATDFITKPINWSLLGQRVKYALKTSQIEEKLRTSQAQLLYSQKIAKLGYWELDVSLDLVSGSNSVFELFGVPFKEHMPIEQFIANIIPKDKPIIEQAISETIRTQQPLQVSFRIHQYNQKITHVDCIGEVIFDDDGEILKLAGSVQDISRLHKAEMLIDYQANHDKLTDLANRTFFTQALTSFIENAPAKTQNAILIFDINRFKLFNDNLGQQKGDLLLKTVALRLKRITREDDFIARLGSDEFAVILKLAKDTQELTSSIHRIIQDLKKPYIIDQQEMFVDFSFGVSQIGEPEESASELIAQANIARAKAKETGNKSFLFYQNDMNDQAKEQLILENDLRKALQRNEIEVYYQPQVYSDTLKPYGAEALVRWNHSELGIISPVVFIPMAESTGLIIEIGRFVLNSAVRELEKWAQMGFDDLHIGVNLSGLQFSHADLMKDVQDILFASSINPKQLDLEITESLAMSNADHNISVLKGLKALGVSISIDDFGTGYSSLAYLHSFPIDAIKIDRSFIVNLSTDQGKAIVNTILAMAESLNLEVVAEGIEEDMHVAHLQDKCCHIFQGFKFGKPMQAAKFEDYLRSKR